MRLKSLELSGFRGFPASHSFDLDADTVILVGANGQGKTSFFDAILWGITGRIPRLGEDDAHLISMYSPSGQARVALELKSSDGDLYNIVRSFDGEQQHLKLTLGDEELREGPATSRLLELLWPEGLLTADGVAALTAAMTRSVYLQQDLVRQFIEADSEQERFTAISELVGTGRVTELQLQLDRDKRAWSRATNTLAGEADTLRQRLRSLEAQLGKLAPLSSEDQGRLDSQWRDWWIAASDLGVQVRQPVRVDTAEASTALDAAVKQLDTLRRGIGRRRQQAIDLLGELQSRFDSQPVADLQQLRAALELAEQELRAATESLGAAQARAAEERRAQVQQRETREELSALAELALRHLDDNCPVCNQAYDKASTRHRLEDLVTGRVFGSEQTQPDEVAALAADVSTKERMRDAARRALREAERMAREQETWIAERDRNLRELRISPTDSDHPAALAALSEALKEQDERVRVWAAAGEQLALSIALASEGARRNELESEIATLTTRLGDLEDSVRNREETGEVAGQLLDGLREAASDVVEAQLEHVEPLLQRIYATIDPHPSFRAIRLLTKFARGRGHIRTILGDTLAELSSESPASVLSSSQMNALAASVFLALNLGMRTLPLEVVMLDDPLQSLDDVNLLGLIDLLRRTKGPRQLFVSTHDARFGALLARKLRPVSESERTLSVEFAGWGRSGPQISMTEIPRDPNQLRVVA